MSRVGIPTAVGGAGVATGAGAGYLAGGIPGAVVGAIGSPLLSELTSRAMVSPNVIDYIANPKPVSIPDILASGVAGTASFTERDQIEAEKARRQAEDDAQIARWQRGG